MSLEPQETESIEDQVPPLEFDWQEFTDFFEGSDLSEAEQQEFLETLWSIIVHFVDLGFGLNPIQILCEQIGENPSSESADMVDLAQALPTNINLDAVDHETHDLAGE